MRNRRYNYQPQMVDPGVIDFGAIQMYNPEDTARLAQVSQGMQQRWDASQSVIAKQLEDIGAANINPRYKADVVSKLEGDIENIYKDVNTIYQGDFGRAFNDVLKSVSKSKSLLHSATQATAEEAKQRDIYNQMAAAGKAPVIYKRDELGRPTPKVMTFEEYHGIDRQPSFVEGRFNAPTFNTLRSAGEYEPYIERMVGHLMKQSTEEGLSIDPKHAAFLRQVKTIGQDPVALRKLFDTNQPEAQAMVEDFIRNNPTVTQEFVDESGKLDINLAKDFLADALVNRVKESTDIQYHKNPDYNPSPSNPGKPIMPLSDLITVSEGAYSPKQLGINPKDIIKNKTSDPFAKEYYQTVKDAVLSKPENESYRGLENIPAVKLDKTKLKNLNISSENADYYQTAVNEILTDYVDLFEGKEDSFWFALSNSGFWNMKRDRLLEEYKMELISEKGYGDLKASNEVDKLRKVLDDSAKTVTKDFIKKRRDLNNIVEKEMDNTPLNYNWLGGAYGTKAGDNMREMFDSGALDIKDLSPIMSEDKKGYDKDYGFLGKTSYNALKEGITKIRVQRGDETKPVSFALYDKTGKAHYTKYLGKNIEVIKDLAFKTNSPELYLDQLAYEKGKEISFSKDLTEGNKRVSLRKVKRSYLETSLGEEVTSKLLGNKKYGYVLVDNETGIEGNARGDIQGLLEYYYRYNGLNSPMQEYGNFLERLEATNRQNQNYGRTLQ